MGDTVREALERVLRAAVQAEYDARYEKLLEVERESRRVERLTTLDFAHVEAEEQLREAREALIKLGYSFEEPKIAVGKSPEYLSDAELGL